MGPAGTRLESSNSRRGLAKKAFAKEKSFWIQERV